MTLTNSGTTLVCLFHHNDQARAALEDLQRAGVPDSSISMIGQTDAQSSGSSALEDLGIPARDLNHLRDGIEDGGTIIAVSAIAEHIDTVERIFGKHRATKIDEAATPEDDLRGAPLGAATPVGGAVAGARATDERAIPVVEEELEVGKRTVDHGGVRIFRRVVEIPAEQSINLREERVVVERNAVDRAATPADLEARGDRSIELTETAEEAVVSKNARVVEEVVVGKEIGEHTEHIRETVRRTEVEVEDLPPAGTRPSSKRSV